MSGIIPYVLSTGKVNGHVREYKYNTNSGWGTMDGNTKATAYCISTTCDLTFTIDTSTTRYYSLIKFVPTVTAKYQFEYKKTSGIDTGASIWDEYGLKYLTDNDDGSSYGGNQPLVSFVCKKNVTYYIQLSHYNTTTRRTFCPTSGTALTGTYTVYVTQTQTLPTGYTDLSYVYATSTGALINTGVADTLKTAIDCHMYVNTGQSNYWFGSTQNSDTMMYNGPYNLSNLEYNWINYTRTSSNTLKMTQFVSGTTNTICMNGTKMSVSTGSVAPTGNIYIFGCNSGSRHYGGTIRCHYFRIYNASGTLVRDFTPVKNSSNECGLYDWVNKTFYGNAGSGNLYGIT